MIAVIVRMWAGPGAQTESYRLLLSALGLTTVGDVVLEREADSHRLVDEPMVRRPVAGHLPYGRGGGLPAVDDYPRRTGAGTGGHRLAAPRVIVLACGIMLPAATLLIDGATGGRVLWPVIGVGALLVSVLVLVRMAGMLRTVEVQAVQLAALARSDALTGAPNRRTWDHELSRACATSLEHGTSLCVAMMDMDHFKAYNDSHGHQAGDRLLREAVAAWTEKLGSAACSPATAVKSLQSSFPTSR